MENKSKKKRNKEVMGNQTIAQWANQIPLGKVTRKELFTVVASMMEAQDAQAREIAEGLTHVTVVMEALLELLQTKALISKEELQEIVAGIYKETMTADNIGGDKDEQ